MQEFKLLAFSDDEFIESDGVDGGPPEIKPEVPKWRHFDDCGTHLVARSNRREVESQYLPQVERFAKVNVDVVQLGHSGMGIHADYRRAMIARAIIFKTGLKTAEVYESIVDDHGAKLKYILGGIPESLTRYDPDDYSP